MSDLTNQIALITLVMIAGLVVMAFGTYLIIVAFFRLPFLFWVHHEAASAASRSEVLNPRNVRVTTPSEDRPNIAA